MGLLVRLFSPAALKEESRKLVAHATFLRHNWVRAGRIDIEHLHRFRQPRSVSFG